MRYINEPAYASFLIALLCLLEYFKVLPSFAGTLLSIQLIVIHAAALVLLFPFIAIPQEAKPTIFKILLALCVFFGLSIDGPFGVIQFAALTYCTYYGYLAKKKAEGDKLPLLLRWAAVFIIFVLVLALTGAPARIDYWAGNRQLALCGFFYFVIAGTVEFGDFYEAGWKDLLRSLSEKSPRFSALLPEQLKKIISPTAENK